MPQIFVILGSEMRTLFTTDLWVLGEELIPLVEEGFGIAGKNDVAFTAIKAEAVKNEATIQIEIRYTAGKDEYGWGRLFDPTEKEQRAVAESVKKKTSAFFEARTLSEYTISVWIKPYYKGVFVSD